MNLPEPSLTKNDKLAKRLIWTVSIVVFAVVVLLHELKLEVDLGFDVHIFAKINAASFCAKNAAAQTRSSCQRASCGVVLG